MPDSSAQFHIAVDGPVSSGKGTVCRLVAKRLGFLYVDTGATYRTTALLAQRAGVDLSNESAVVAELKKAKLDMRAPVGAEDDGRLITMLLNDEDVSWTIRTEEVSAGSSKVAVHPEVRKLLVKKQQEIAQGQNVIMEGRDITYRVLPAAELKIYLNASDVVRAKRRLLQLQTKGHDVSFEDVYQDLLERDERDMNRATDPLKIVDEAWVIDSSDLSIAQVVDLISAKVQVMMEH